jgi:hypothetical protein
MVRIASNLGLDQTLSLHTFPHMKKRGAGQKPRASLFMVPRLCRFRRAS